MRLISEQEVLEKALELLKPRANLTSYNAHPLNDTYYKELFKALFDKGYGFTCGQVKLAADALSWPDDHAHKLAQLAERVGAGGRVQIRNKQNWGVGAVEKILNDVG